MESGLTTHQLSEELDQQRGSRHPGSEQSRHLARAQVSRQELAEPDQYVTALRAREIRVLSCSRVVVVTLVLPTTGLIRQSCVEHQSQCTEGIVQANMPRPEQPVHCIVGNNEQTCLQLCSQQDEHHEEPHRTLSAVASKRKGQG